MALKGRPVAPPCAVTGYVVSYRVMNYKIAASILNANFLHLKQEIDAVISHVDEIHLDIIDGVFADNISFGPPVLENIRATYPNAVLDTHMMLMRPELFWKAFHKLGSTFITFHYEVTPHSYIILKQMKDAGVKTGMALTPATDCSALEAIKDLIDRVLILTVEPGFGGQDMIPQMLTKVERTRKMFGERVDIEVDGGINDKTIRSAKDAGANVFVIGSYIFKAEDKKTRVATLRDQLT